MPRNKRPPTPRMADLVEAVEALTASNGYPPSWQELADKLRVCKGRVQHLANGARERGVVTWKPYTHRSIRPVQVRRQKPRG